MLECLIIGDSIAVGLAQHRPECASFSKGGINTWQYNKQYKSQNLTADTVIISLGSNDHKHIKTLDELTKLRQRVQARQVYWILPQGNLKASEVPIENIQAIVKQLATEHGDIVVPITRVQKDNIHPSTAGYKDLKEKTQ
jgi:lysophospholipase L1-like esterase